MEHSFFTTAILLCLFCLMAISVSPQQKEIPDFSTVERSKVPDEYKWKIDDIYPDMEVWQADKEKIKVWIKEIDKAEKDWTSSAQKLLAFFDLTDRIQMTAYKLYAYASHQSDADMSDVLFQKMKGGLQMIFVELRAKTSFIRPDIIKLGKDKFEEYVKAEPKLEQYRMGVDSIFHIKDHILPTDKEQIIAMTGLFAGATARASNMLNNVEIPRPKVRLSDGVEYELNYQTYQRLRESRNPADREKNMLTFWDNHKKFENTLAILLDAEIKSHLFDTKVRGYKTCLESQLFPSKIDLSVYHNLIATVRVNLSPLHRYLKLKKELLGLETFKYADIYASAVPKVDKRFTFDETRKIIIEAMRPLGKEYTDALTEGFMKRWIDIYANKNKQSGAYSDGVYGVHPYVKLNYDGTYSALSTTAHELGHSLHSYFSDKTQPFATHDYPIFLAEIASTFNENMLLDYLLKSDKDDLFKLYVLDGYIDQLRGTIYRQTLFAEFELAMHEFVEAGGTLTPDLLNAKYLELTREYYGNKDGVCQVDNYIQNEWEAIPHFYYNFYVYQYSTGIMSSIALADMVLKEGKPGRDRYLGFLKAGGSKYPLETLKDAGVDLTTTKPFEAALKRFDSLVAEMEKIAAKLKKEGKL